MRGIPQTVSALTTASADDALAVLFVEPEVATVGEIVRRMLSQFADAALCVFDAAGNRIIGTTDAGTALGILSAWDAATGDSLTLEPRPTIAGVNLLWQVVSADGIALEDLLANDFQRRNISGLINTGLSQYRLTPPFPSVLVDQATGHVVFKLADASLTASMDTLTPAGQTVCVRFAPAKTKLIFE